MTKRQIIQRLFLRFLMNNTFYKQEFIHIWSLFISEKKLLDDDENIEIVQDFFKQLLEKEYFIVEANTVPKQYTSTYHVYQIKKLCLPEELRSSYESIYLKTQNLNNAIRRNELELELEYLNECFNDYPSIRFQVEILIQQKQEHQYSLQSKINVLKELIQFF
ncbi:hypothetical protein OHW24_16090 [Acinetobacter baumannii]|nr:hypothetical protein [Acinetobacter baumannii]